MTSKRTQPTGTIRLRNLTGHHIPIPELNGTATLGLPAGTLILDPHETVEITRGQFDLLCAINRQRGHQPGWTVNGLAVVEVT